MKLIKPKFWGTKKSVFPYVLLPITFTLILLIWIKKKITRVLKFKVKVICIGNIYLGGTGKTPLSIFLAKEISKIGKKTAIIRKFYKNHIDEYKLIEKNFSYLITEKNRIDGINKAIKRGFDTVILDDGFQDYKIKKNLSIICFNQNQLIGNGYIFPSGPLRENLSSLKYAQIILINGNKDLSFEKKLLSINNKLEIFYSKYKALNTDEFKNKKLLALAGIGNPENFFDLLKSYNLKIEKKYIFPDHYIFKKKEMLDIVSDAEDNNCEIVMTEKDYFKIKNFSIKKLNYLKVDLEIKDKNKFIESILKAR